jgi:hypothetical protein
MQVSHYKIHLKLPALKDETAIAMRKEMEGTR